MSTLDLKRHTYQNIFRTLLHIHFKYIEVISCKNSPHPSWGWRRGPFLLPAHANRYITRLRIASLRTLRATGAKHASLYFWSPSSSPSLSFSLVLTWAQNNRGGSFRWKRVKRGGGGRILLSIVLSLFSSQEGFSQALLSFPSPSFSPRGSFPRWKWVTFLLSGECLGKYNLYISVCVCVCVCVCAYKVFTV